MHAIKKTLLAINELIKTDAYWHLPVDVTAEIAASKKELVLELEAEIKSLKAMASDMYSRGHNTHLSGTKQNKAKLLMKSSKSFEEMADDLEQWLLLHK